MGIRETIMHQSGVEENLTADEHLALEWDLFQRIERGAARDFCRTWETSRPAVVIGRNTSIADQVIQEACRDDEVPIVRRCSGGGAVVLGPGCLNYAFGYSLVSRPDLADVAVSFSRILEWVAAALGVAGLAIQGTTDLAVNGLKVSGNAQRRGRRTLLHHGTLLYAFDTRLAARYLKEPVRRPPYRAARQHVDFMTNLPLTRPCLEICVTRAWSHDEPGPWTTDGLAR